MIDQWTIAEAYSCPVCGGLVAYLRTDPEESDEEPMQCITPDCAAVVEIDMDTGEWFSVRWDEDRSRRAGA